MAAAAVTVIVLALSKVRALVTERGLIPAMAGVGAGVKSMTGKAQRFVGEAGKSYLSRMAMVTSLVFAAQMFNFPVAQGISGHLLGGLFAALFLGPWGGGFVDDDSIDRPSNPICGWGAYCFGCKYHEYGFLRLYRQLFCLCSFQENRVCR